MDFSMEMLSKTFLPRHTILKCHGISAVKVDATSVEAFTARYFFYGVT